MKKSTYNPQKTEGKPYSTKQGKLRQSNCYGKSKTGFRTNNNDGLYHPKTIVSGFYDPDMFNSKITNKPRHPTQKPLDLVEYLVKTYSNEGDLILDPFGGSGTTAVAAQNLNRNCICIESHDEYIDIAKARLNLNQVVDSKE